MAKIQNLIEKKGFRVFTVPEAATLLMNAGAMIENKKMSVEQSMNFQIQLMKMQLSLEDTIHNIAINNQDPAVLLMDRGLMDTAGYVGWDAFNTIL